MEFLVMSAGSSADKDYLWVDEHNAEAKATASRYTEISNSAKFIWKKTSDEICIMANCIEDKERIDYYNRPLRDYLMVIAKEKEAEDIFCCFTNMLLRQDEFEQFLKKSVTTSSVQQGAGFEVDLSELKKFLLSKNNPVIGKKKLRKNYCELDSVSARLNVLSELRGALNDEMLVLIGGKNTVQTIKAMHPDRALLENIVEGFSSREELIPKRLIVPAAAAVTSVIAVVVTLIYMKNRKDD